MKTLSTAIIAILVLLTVDLYAQKLPTRLIKKGQADLYLTVGLLPTFLADGAKQKMMPLNIGADLMVGDNFSIGGTFGHSISETGNTEFQGGENGNLKNSYYEFGVKTGLHITKYDNMSIYGGFIFSYHLSKIQAMEGDMEKIAHHSGIQTNQGKFLPGGYMGFKYAVAKKWTVMAELGYGVSILRIGAGYRFK